MQFTTNKKNHTFLNNTSIPGNTRVNLNMMMFTTPKDAVVEDIISEKPAQQKPVAQKPVKKENNVISSNQSESKVSFGDLTKELDENIRTIRKETTQAVKSRNMFPKKKRGGCGCGGRKK